MLIRGYDAASLPGSEAAFRRAHGGGIHGLNAFADALDDGVSLHQPTGIRLTDLCAIALGWAMLMVVIFYPALQLVAIAACAAVIGLMSLVRAVVDMIRGDSSRRIPDRGFAPPRFG
jgi:hypothetical protein